MVYEETVQLSTQQKSATERLGNGGSIKWELKILKAECWQIQWG